jgi:sugar phosphate isomerase/epimerase
MPLTRRQFFAATAAAAASAQFTAARHATAQEPAASPAMRLGLVTYLWGQDWDLPTLLKNCEATGLLGVELRTQHKHGVEPGLSAAARQEVRQRFADSPVTLVGYGSNAEFHSPDPAEVQRNIELTKSYVQLMHDCGGSGVKVKPNSLPKDVPVEKTLTQIGEALNTVAAYAADFQQKIRLEVHGQGTSELPHIKSIMDVATHPNVGVCWNSNATDLSGDGLTHNFGLIRTRLADTAHVRELTAGDYPYAELMKLFSAAKFTGWILLECHSNPADRMAAIKAQVEEFGRIVFSVQCSVFSD